MIAWLTTTTFGKFIATFLISMLPVVELRAGLPYGIGYGLDYPLALTAALLGNFLPAPFVIVYIRGIFQWIRRHIKWLDGTVGKLEEKAHLKGHLVTKYSTLGLFILVAIPIPGTGVWTGALVAALLDIRLRRALPAIFLGLLASAAIITVMTFGVIHLF